MGLDNCLLPPESGWVLHSFDLHPLDQPSTDLNAVIRWSGADISSAGVDFQTA